jgi:nucleoside-diphosphate-sugar epimerase
MRVVVIGGTGHVGTYLVPRLVEAGYDVICISRGQRDPYHPHAAWKSVRRVAIDRSAEEAAGIFGECVRDLAPDVVIDIICFSLDSARHLVEALRGQMQYFLHCGTIWVHGHSVQVPTTEEQPRNPLDDYGAQKAAIEVYLLSESRRHGFPATILHPGQIVGPGWPTLNPAGHFSPQVFARLARGEELVLPNLGMETVHHVHADDVAHAFVQTLANWSSAVGESFHVVSPAALTLRGSEQEAVDTWDLISHSPNCSIAKARRLLGYRPRYSSLQAVYEAVNWSLAEGIIDV